MMMDDKGDIDDDEVAAADEEVELWTPLRTPNVLRKRVSFWEAEAVMSWGEGFFVCVHGFRFQPLLLTCGM